MGIEPQQILSEDQAWDLLASASFGRIALSVEDSPEIFPINIVADPDTGTILFRTAVGTKLSEVAVNGQVAFETDAYTDKVGWSVVAKGTARILSTSKEIADAEQAPLRPWIPTVKPNFVEIDVEEITGRRFDFGPEPDREF